MQLLVVHHDAEVGEQLVQMVKDYTRHECDLAMSETAAMMWGRAHERCALLITELTGPDIDGLRLGAAVSELFPGLQTIFLPSYAASEQRIEVAATKVFPEPIDGELLLDAIERAVTSVHNGSDYFHVLDILQMCCLSERSGAVQIVQRNRIAVVFLRDGKIVHAETSAARGSEALFQICGWDEVEFAYDESVRASETIAMPWDEALIEAVRRRKKAKAAILTPPEAPLRGKRPLISRLLSR